MSDFGIGAAVRRKEVGVGSNRYRQPTCLVPDFDGASSSHDSKEALWDKFYTAAPPRRRQSVEQYKILCFLIIVRQPSGRRTGPPRSIERL
jgi:hypothetical protein